MEAGKGRRAKKCLEMRVGKSERDCRRGGEGEEREEKQGGPRRNLIWKRKVPNSRKKSTLARSLAPCIHRKARDDFSRGKFPSSSFPPHSVPNSPSLPSDIDSEAQTWSSYLIYRSEPRLTPLTNYKIDLIHSLIHSLTQSLVGHGQIYSRSGAADRRHRGRIWKSGT